MNSTLLENSPYWPYYCEENIWALCRTLKGQQVEARAIVVTGRDGPVAFLGQRVAPSQENLLMWDYHVFLLFREPGQGWQTFDPDTVLPRPSSVDAYCKGSFPALENSSLAHRPLFRCIEAPVYLKTLCSDRRHMLGTDGQYLQPPPPWSRIGQGHNLDRLIDMSDPSLVKF
ncbi:MAG: hypothetical protein P8M78_00580 [Myxococcota bacterium]|nr:hypothetical protein [Myxococcota bacterium]